MSFVGMKSVNFVVSKTPVNLSPQISLYFLQHQSQFFMNSTNSPFTVNLSLTIEEIEMEEQAEFL